MRALSFADRQETDTAMNKTEQKSVGNSDTHGMAPKTWRSLTCDHSAEVQLSPVKVDQVHSEKKAEARKIFRGTT